MSVYSPSHIPPPTGMHYENKKKCTLSYIHVQLLVTTHLWHGVGNYYSCTAAHCLCSHKTFGLSMPT